MSKHWEGKHCKEKKIKVHAAFHSTPQNFTSRYAGVLLIFA